MSVAMVTTFPSAARRDVDGGVATLPAYVGSPCFSPLITHCNFTSAASKGSAEHRAGAMHPLKDRRAMRPDARWIESVEEVGQDLKTFKGNIFIDMKY